MADKFLPYPDYKLFYLLTLGNRLVEGRSGDTANREAPLDALVLKKIGWYRQILAMLYWYDGTGDAADVTCPVLVMHGSGDRLVPYREAVTSKTRFRSAKSATFENTGHSLIFSQAAWCSTEIGNFVGQ
jgi:pimeloyl-ACP methyl ester carboxylesterase